MTSPDTAKCSAACSWAIGGRGRGAPSSPSCSAGCSSGCGVSPMKNSQRGILPVSSADSWPPPMWKAHTVPADTMTLMESTTCMTACCCACCACWWLPSTLVRCMCCASLPGSPGPWRRTGERRARGANWDSAAGRASEPEARSGCPRWLEEAEGPGAPPAPGCHGQVPLDSRLWPLRRPKKRLPPEGLATWLVVLPAGRPSPLESSARLGAQGAALPTLMLMLLLWQAASGLPPCAYAASAAPLMLRPRQGAAAALSSRRSMDCRPPCSLIGASSSVGTPATCPAGTSSTACCPAAPWSAGASPLPAGDNVSPEATACRASAAAPPRSPSPAPGKLTPEGTACSCS